VRAVLEAAGIGAEVTDMLETTEHAAPPGWDASLGFGLDVLTEMQRARIAVAPGEVTITAVLSSDTARASMRAALSAAVPDGVALHLDLSAPRPVIAPFRLDFRLAGGEARLLACSAETETAAAEILAAGRAAGLAEEADCTLGLGAPSVGWAAAAVAGIAAVKELGGGRFALSDSQAELTGPTGITADELAAAAGRLAAALPASYPLSTTSLSQMTPEPRATAAQVPRFAADLAPDGTVLLRGAVHDSISKAAIESYAEALFGHLQVSNRTMIDPDLPDGWPARVLAGIEGLASTVEGRLEVTPERISLSGRSLVADADAQIEALLADKAPGDASVVVHFDARAAARASEAAMPAPERCADEIAAILESEAIVFRPGSAEIDPVSGGVIAATADVLRECPGAAFEVAGHTDSSGEAEANQRLSDDRAVAVAAALRDLDLPMIDLHPRGYGASRPRASNATPVSRALNRRIELTLHKPPEPQAVAALPVWSDVGFPEMARAEPALSDAASCAAEIAALLASDPIEFELGSSRISSDSASVLATVAEALRGCGGGGLAFEVAGHTDDRGPAEVNQRLSEERAEAVRSALATREVLGAVALVARGYGPDRPVADNATREGRTRNRRIEITLLPVAADRDPALLAEEDPADVADGPQ
jgi:OOP family OmpA-OmpF porin